MGRSSAIIIIGLSGIRIFHISINLFKWSSLDSITNKNLQSSHRKW